MAEERIQKILAQAGVASRRACEDLIRQGRVTVNDAVVGLGAKADPARDTIQVDGETIVLENVKRVYIMLYKPTGVVSASQAQHQEERPTVRDLVPLEGRLYPVGRLDADSEGLILLTNDGDLTHRLTHPRYGHPKTYSVLIKGHPSMAVLQQWREGVQLDDGRTRSCDVQVIERLAGGTWLKLVLREGRKRQIRRTAIALGLHVKRLIRTHFGPLTLGELKPGEWRYLDGTEIKSLREGIKAPRARRRTQRGKPRSARQAGGQSARKKRDKRRKRGQKGKPS